MFKTAPIYQQWHKKPLSHRRTYKSELLKLLTFFPRFIVLFSATTSDEERPFLRFASYGKHAYRPNKINKNMREVFANFDKRSFHNPDNRLINNSEPAIIKLSCSGIPLLIRLRSCYNSVDVTSTLNVNNTDLRNQQISQDENGCYWNTTAYEFCTCGILIR